MFLPKILLFPKVYVSFFAVYLFGLNIGVSAFVKLFTSDGAMTGMTNLFASVFIGLISTYQVYSFKKKWNIEYSKIK
jgi:ABC-type lipoprotein release transport system permease subunit